MSTMFGNLAAIAVGLAGGLAVGGGFVAFLTVLDILPRLAQWIRSRSCAASFELAVVSGVLVFTLSDFLHLRFHFPLIAASLPGFFSGVFVGMLAAGLTEVLNVFPILAKRLQLSAFVKWLVLAAVLGKTAGSLFHWIVYSSL